MTRRALVMAVAILVGVAVLDAQEQSRVDRRCAEPRACSPPWASTLLIWVVDAQGAAIGDADIGISPSLFAGPPNRRVESVRTDRSGLAAISLDSSTNYRLRVSAAGFQPIDIPRLRINDGNVEAIRITLEIDWKQVR